MKIATFNVNSINARKDLIKRWLLEKNSVDILAFQEIKCEESKFPFEEFKELGYECEIFGQKAYNGVAICSKFEIKEIKKGFGDPFWDSQKRFIEAKIEDLTLINIYAPHGEIEGEKHIYKLNFFGKLKNYIKENFDLNKNKLCVVGDMNVAKDEIDVWDPELLRETIGFMSDERETFKDFLSIGLIDLFRECKKDESGFSWFDYRNAGVWRNEGMRIDYILTSNPLKNLCKDIYVDMWTRKRRSPTPSDHAPVVAEFNI